MRLRPPKRIMQWLLMAMLWWIPPPLVCASLAAPTAHLVDAVEEHDLWPMATILAERGEPMTAAEALARSSEFRVPETPHANLGQLRQPVWLRVALSVDPTSDGDWILDIDYPALDEVAVTLIPDSGPWQEFALGRDIPFEQRPLPTRSHGVALTLDPGRSYLLLMRVATKSSVIVPARLMKPTRISLREARIELLQGIAAGIGLCLVLYALAHWVSLHDASFFYYALNVGSITLFFFTFEGLSDQHLWGGSPWLTQNAAPLLIQPALTGGLLFLERTLRVRQLLPWLGRIILATAGITVAVALLFLLGAMDYRQAQLAGTILGPTPIILGLPAAWIRARQGDRVALYILFGWGIYAIGIFTMAALLRGLIGLNVWSHHAFQIGALVEMVVWVLVLGVRASEIRLKAERAEKERTTLHRLAHTDGLTGLLNRRGLQERMEEEISRSTPEHLSAVYLLDLDGFKTVNDRLGHAAGDDLLRGVGERLRATLRATDVVARLGGDEFVILAVHLSSEAHAHQLGQKLLRAFREPFRVQDQPCSIGLTIGYALAPIDGARCAALLKLADAAMYAGKQAGKGCARRTAPIDPARPEAETT